MNILNKKLVPFKGLGDIKLMSYLEDVKEILNQNKIKYKISYQSNKGCTPEVPWTLIQIDSSITLIFAKNMLFEIYCENKFAGTLLNNLKIGMFMDDALKIDPTLKFDDLNEDYISTNGYWIENDLDTNTIISITIFIKEVLDDNLFFSYKWCNKENR